MDLLLDSCSFIWLATDPGQLSIAATSAINNQDAILCVSHASLWEIAVKHEAGKLHLPKPPRIWWPEQVSRWLITELPLNQEVLFLGSELPKHHKDPFDRAIIAQALTRDLSIISPDPHFPSYSVKIIW